MAETAKRIYWLPLFVVFTGSAVLGAVLFYFNPSTYGFYPTCLLHRTTGLLCPGCGSLRAIHQLLHGHISAAFRFNALLVVSLPLCVWFGGRYVVKKLRGEALSAPPVIWLWVMGATILVFSIWRNLPGSALAMLPP